MFQILFVAGLSFSSPKFSRAGGPFRWLREFKILQVVQRQENHYSGNEISQIGSKMHFTLIFTLFSSELSRTEYHPGDFENKRLLLTFTVHFLNRQGTVNG